MYIRANEYMELLTNIHIQNIETILRNVGERVEGNLICDIEPNNYTIHRNIEKIRNLQTLCNGKRRICEIGVNAAHSLLLMLFANPNAEYTLFDLGNHGYTRPCVEYIQSKFPSTRIEIIYGNSVETVAKYIREHPEKQGTYDLCHLDGGHTPDIFTHDYANVKKLLGNGIVVFDDYDLPAIHSFLDSMVSTGKIVEVKHSDLLKTDLHFIYRYV
ncbi:MAG: class I SAM-dependent methyltransferase [Bacteroidetes bacterium]|nr:class I SAM-dependent methyltransferase [bacterium]NBP66161.1 class I SAM-dependent methyltransferase [Bacteroidota bacterium]